MGVHREQQDDDDAEGGQGRAGRVLDAVQPRGGAVDDLHPARRHGPGV